MNRGQMFSGKSLRKLAKGFTLLEMLFVVVIVGVMSTVIGPRYFNQLMKTENTAAVAQLSTFGHALDVYLLDIGTYPTTDQGLAALLTAPAGTPQWMGPYLDQQEVPLDPWGNAFVYVCPALSPTYTLYTTGRDITNPADDIYAPSSLNALNLGISAYRAVTSLGINSLLQAAQSAATGSTTPADPTATTTGATEIQATTTAQNSFVEPLGFTDAVGIIQG